MSITVETGTTLAFDAFWRWVKEHPNCVLRAGTPDVWLYDQEDLHWHFEEDRQHAPIVQLIRGKHLLGEIVIDAREVLFVQATPDVESGEKGNFLFEVMGGSKEDTYAVYHFLLAHGFEETVSHQEMIKH